MHVTAQCVMVVSASQLLAVASVMIEKFYDRFINL